ncbi:hypothetical protein O3G_MSEX008085 [Manduca sexta]|uniref:Uncharacterized protein n=1 Tax=Manduca sexta TaxID=7130 RepID=A0A921Z980_MANSE|nr:hypothetical protein O3G_MSEX008085 [Manduca sexta]
MASNKLSPEDKEFLEKCEEEFKDRFTENDEEFMKVFNAGVSIPPIVDSWWVPNNSGRRNDRRDNRRNHPYERHGNRDRNRDFHDRRERDNYSRGYNDYNQQYDNSRGYRNQRPRHY